MAESDDIVLALISHILNREGYLVDVACTALEAESRLAANIPDAALLDTKLPGGGADWMRRCIPDGEQRLIILTSATLEEDVPAAAVLRKPIEFNLLLETVAACVNSID
ncbi:MAG TPA: response regulator [Thermoanaerobaculia bacterium]